MIQLIHPEGVAQRLPPSSPPGPYGSKAIQIKGLASIWGRGRVGGDGIFIEPLINIFPRFLPFPSRKSIAAKLFFLGPLDTSPQQGAQTPAMETSPALQPIVASTIRHGLTALAGVLVARGLLTEGATAEFVSVGVGLLVGAIGYGWSLARAGRLGSQARTIADLMDRLLTSVPLSAVPSAGPVMNQPGMGDTKTELVQTTPVQFTNNDTGQS
jgi:hypothetical protein